jgi:5-methylcytosine-specific restriction endonuclease McrBC GTP-binding regulatory subunit McrB
LIIDEMNRGNLPRIFGELLFLLEYREQEVELPYSHRRFRLPTNLYLIGTMNALDRSTTPIDNALRRRFSILEMAPDARILARWLGEHPPRDPGLAPVVFEIFERLNDRLREDVGPDAQVGHSYFMVRDLDEDRLNVVWKHHVMPLLSGLFLSQPGRLTGYDLDAFLKGESARRRGRRPVRA